MSRGAPSLACAADRLSTNLGPASVWALTTLASRATHRPWCHTSSQAAASLIWTVVPGHSGAEYALVRMRTRLWPSTRAKLNSTRLNPSLAIGSRWSRSSASASPTVSWRPSMVRASSSRQPANSMAFSSSRLRALGTGTRWLRRKNPTSPSTPPFRGPRWRAEAGFKAPSASGRPRSAPFLHVGDRAGFSSPLRRGCRTAADGIRRPGTGAPSG
jgi:hypothetical protein